MAEEQQAQAAEPQEPSIADWAQDDAPETQEQQPVAQAQPQDGEGEQEAQAEAEPQEPEAEDDPAPEFWNADAKALWAKLKDQPELRAALKDMNARERRAVAAKFEEAAERAKAAEAAKAKHDADLAHVAKWFEENGPVIVQTIQGRWAGMTQDKWLALARENPAQYTELRAMYEADMQRAQQVARQHEGVRTQQAKQQEEAFAKARADSHAKLAEEMPDAFGPGKAEATYSALSQYLVDQGVPRERIPFIHEPYVVKTVLKAYKYDQLQAKMKAGGTQPAQGQQNATMTPRRIQPGPAANGAGNRQSDAERQAMEALRSGRRLTADEAALAFR